MEVKVYTTPTCPWCKKTKNFLEDNEVDFEEFDVSHDEEAAEEMIEKTGQRGVPVTIVEKEGEDRIIIGYDKERLGQAVGV